MLRFARFAAAPAFVVLMGGTAHAALTADQIWQSWKDGGTGMGLAVAAANESAAGGVLTLTGVTLTAPGAPAPLTISELTLTEESNGTVTIRPGAEIGFAAKEGETGGAVNFTHDNLVITVREEAGGLAYDYTANAFAGAYDFTYEAGYRFDQSQPAQYANSTGTISTTALKGTYSDIPGTNRVLGLKFAAEALATEMVTKDDAAQTNSTSSSTGTDLNADLTVTLPSAISMLAIQSPGDFAAALKEGFAVNITSTQASSTSNVKEDNPYFPLEMVATGGPATGDLVFNKDKFEVNSAGDALDVTIASPGNLPVPAHLTSGKMNLSFLAPVSSGETAGDFGLKLGLADLVLNDETWALFDPTAKLKREAAQLDLDISGKAKIDLISVLAAEGAGVPAPEPQPESLNINKAVLKVAGAALDATGAFTFDNSMGMPLPLGSADIKLNGANQLIDGLIAAGLLQENDAMGARMMMGMFMVPGTEPDSLTSKVEAKEGFSIFVNGQQIQ